MGSSARFRYSAYALVILLGANLALSAQRSTSPPSVGVIPVLGQWDHATEGTTYLYVRYNTRDDNVALWRFTKGQREVIGHGASHRRLALNAWHPFSLTIKGRTISAVAAGDLRVEHTLDRAISGRVGLWTKRDSITAFRSWRAD